MRITVFGANGPTGRLLTGQALAAGHQVTAVTRQPESFLLHHDRLEIVGADVLDPVAVDAVVAQRDAVLSTLGVPAGKEPISTYSRGVGTIVAAMERHRVRRLPVVSSSGVDPHPYSDGGVLFNRVLRVAGLRSGAQHDGRDDHSGDERERGTGEEVGAAARAGPRGTVMTQSSRSMGAI